MQWVGYNVREEEMTVAPVVTLVELGKKSKRFLLFFFFPVRLEAKSRGENKNVSGGVGIKS